MISWKSVNGLNMIFMVLFLNFPYTRIPGTPDSALLFLSDHSYFNARIAFLYQTMLIYV